jgi:membrane-bound lytic murein transglycosylase MltF
MKNKINPSKTLCIVLLVAAALYLIIMLGTMISLRNQLNDALTRASEAESLVDTYTVVLANEREANAALQADNEALRRSNDELQNTNNKLRESLAAYDFDFSVKDPEPPHYLDVPVDEELQQYIWSLCCAYDIEEHYVLIYAMMYRESSFRSHLISATNDYGIMQINKCNHKSLSNKLGIDDFLDPYQNVHAGIYMIANLIHKYGNVNDALMAYNMGDAGAAKLWRRGVHTTSYVERVLATYNQYSEDI